MKKLIYAVMLLCIGSSYAQEKKAFNDTTLLQPIEVQAIRAQDKAPFAKTNLSKAEIEKNNTGQDLPFLLNQLPSVIVNSDAGNGVGYTGIRIRGTDASRINVSINGIPYNDAESQGTFFVDLPDISSSAGSIQVQRGVGTSNIGSGSFGGSINIATNEVNDKFQAELNNSAGTYNTFKHTFKISSGLLGKHFMIDGRLSKISSDGYIDRAATSLYAGQASLSYVDASNSLRFNLISGKEKTYQAWNGVPESYLDSNRTYNISGQEQPGKPYENETDNYTQTHYQLFYTRKFNPYWNASVAVFLTRGKGYYEEYRATQQLGNYGLFDYYDGTNTISSTDLVRRKWLDNYFYGTVFSVQHQKNNTQFTAGGGWNGYDGKHFGEIIWAKVQAAIPAHYRWYDLAAFKKDFSLYAKLSQQWTPRWQAYLDLQYRNVQYHINGFKDNPGLLLRNSYAFANPKAGLTYTKGKWQAYLSYAISGKEPNRDDFEAGINQQPKAEYLQDWELGIERKNNHASWSANIYYMKYKDQLVLTGKINDVGAYTRTNIPNSYRIGIELQGKYIINKWLNVTGNLTLSENKVKDFTEYIDDYDNGGQVTNTYKKSDISFSPAIVGAASVNILPVKNGEISLNGKYVSRQYLDNTSQKSRSIAPYYVQDIRLGYTIDKKFFKCTKLFLQLNNVFNKLYEANGYTFSYIYGGLQTENYYYPMAPFNLMAGVNISL